MRKKTSSIILALVLILVFTLTGCGKTANTPAATGSEPPVANSETPGSGSTELKGKITIWAWDPNFNIAIMNEAKKIYTAKNPNVEIEVVEFAKADVEQKLLVNLSSGTTDGLPDIVLIEDYNAANYLSAYPKSFADLTNVIDYSQFAPYKVKLMTLDGKTYGIPFDSGVAGFFYRKDILEQAGFKASDLENITWDRFIEIGETVKAKTGVSMCAFDPSDGGLVRVMLNSAGAWYFDKDGNPNLTNNPALKKAIETYAKIINSPMTMQTSGWAEWVGAINSGNAASISTGVWIMGSVKAEPSQSGLWAVAPIPRLDLQGSVNASNLGGSSWYILESSKVKDVAIDFMKETYCKDVDFYQTILVNNGAVGTFLPSQSGEAYMQADEFFGGQKVFQDFSKYMMEIPSIDYGSYTYEADAAIAAILPSV
jgi:lactose/L-arabinose transport system substrate-binding protein